MVQQWASSRSVPTQKQQQPGSAGSVEEIRTGSLAVATGTSRMSHCSKCGSITPSRYYPAFSTFIKLLTFPSFSEEPTDECLVSFAHYVGRADHTLP